MPSVTPAAVETPTATVPNFTASHAPYADRLKMSLALASVPNRY